MNRLHRPSSSISPIMAFSKTITTQSLPLILFLILILVRSTPSFARSPHVINFRSPNLYPEGLTWDPSGQHFLVGSLNHRSIYSVSDAAVVETLISDPTLPENTTVLGLAIDSIHNRLLAIVHSAPPLPPFNALAAYDLRTRHRVFLSLLDDETPEVITTERHVAKDVAVDFNGNAYVTNSAGNFIWKVDKDGKASVFSRCPGFTRAPSAVDRDAPSSERGLSGIDYVSKGYLLVVQSKTGKMFKVNEDNGSSRRVILNEDLTGADGIAIRKDGVVLVVSRHTLWFIKSDDSWAEGVVYDKTALDEEKFATAVTIGGGDRAYVLYGHVMEEGIKGNSWGREEFSIEEVRSEKENEEENVWVFVLVGLGLAYFLFWRFQMSKLVKDMNKKIN